MLAVALIVTGALLVAVAVVAMWGWAFGLAVVGGTMLAIGIDLGRPPKR